MTARRRREAGGPPLKRKVATRRPRKIVVVFCEGTRTEPEYLEALKRLPRVREAASVDIRVETGRGRTDDQTAWLDNAEARRLRGKLDGSGDKGLLPAIYMPHVGTAARRAAALESRHRGDGTDFPDDNPSSGMHWLIATVQPAEPEKEFEGR